MAFFFLNSHFKKTEELVSKGPKLWIVFTTELDNKISRCEDKPPADIRQAIRNLAVQEKTTLRYSADHAQRTLQMSMRTHLKPEEFLSVSLGCRSCSEVRRYRQVQLSLVTVDPDCHGTHLGAESLGID